MTSSENPMSYDESWLSTAAFADSWLDEALARDTETLMTRALQKSISEDTIVSSSGAVFSPFHRSETTSVSGSDFEAVTPRSRAAETVVKAASTAPVKKIAKPKRKPRVSKKKSQTTLIMADPLHFRKMVQEVTGARLESLNQQQQMQIPAHQILKPEPKRFTGGSAALPTLDTSSFVLDQQLVGVGQTALTGGEVSFGESTLLGGSGSGSGDGYGCYPTLESWKAM